MINRGRTKSSAYVFNAKSGKLEKKDDKVQTIESLSKQLKASPKSLDDLAKNINKQQEDEKPVNNIVVITAEDSLIHNYFTDVDISWDSINCLSTAIIKMPKIDVENLTYWTNYTGQLTVYVGNDFVFDYVNENSNDTEQDAANSLVKYWDNSDIKPFFRGEVARIKEFENDVKIYVDSIGRRFQQKIPDEFRQSFINNQNVRDAFQAICEFLGVFYICPPKTVTDNGETTTEDQLTGDGQENDVNTQQNAEQTMRNIAQNKAQQQIQSMQNNSGATGTNTTTNPQDPNAQTTDENGEAIEGNEEVPDIQNGYGDINFDANGALVHGSAVIETSPDMEDTLVAMEEHPFEKYLEDETGIIESVKKFLDGDMFEELHNKVMDYGAITIEPKAAASPQMSTMPTQTPTDQQQNQNGTTDGTNGTGMNTGTGTNNTTSTGTRM